MKATTVITASEAKANLSELLDRVQGGESFSITLRGKEVAKLLPARKRSREEIQRVIAEMKRSRACSTLRENQSSGLRI